MVEDGLKVLEDVKKVLEVAAGSGGGHHHAARSDGRMEAGQGNSAQDGRQCGEQGGQQYQDTASALSSETSQQRDIRLALSAHNAARRSARFNAPSHHRRPDLVWSQTLSTQAQKYAEEMTRKDRFEHSSAGARGAAWENLYSWTGFSREPKRLVDAVEAWVAEKKYYNGQKAGTQGSHKWGHYSQVIWPSTTKVGMGIAHGKEGKVYVVGRYGPQGNIRGRSAWDFLFEDIREREVESALTNR
ncbi:CAP domain-containing protein [Halenospora varia]|nr:CAP domain-containing protein [Halenospora varia]